MKNKYALCLKLFFILVPFIYFNSTIDPVLIPRQLFLSFFLLAIFLFSLFERHRFSTYVNFSNPVLLLAIVFFVTVTASFITAINKAETAYLVSKVGIITSFLLLAYSLLKSSKIMIGDFTEGIVFMVFIVNVVAIIQIATIVFNQNISLNDLGNEAFLNKINSTLANKNLLCSLLVISFPFLYRGTFAKPFIKIVSWFTVITSLFLIAILQSRAALLGISVIGFFIIYEYLREKKNSKKRLHSILFSFLFLLVIATYILHLTGVSQSSTHLQNTHSINTRWLLWKSSLQMFREHWLGVGGGNWQIYFPKYDLQLFDKQVSEGWATYQRPHNDFLWIACETGLIGLLVYLLLLFFVLKKAIFRYRTQQENPRERSFLLITISGILAYAIISFCDFPFERIEHHVLFSSLMLVAIYDSSWQKKTDVHSPGLKRFYSAAIPVFLLLTISFSILVGVMRYNGEKHTHKLIEAHHREDWNKMIKESDKAENIFYNMDFYSAPVSWYKGVALFSIGNINDATAAFENARRIHPYHIHVLNNLASCYEKLNRHEEAIALYKEALSISPGFQESKLNLSASYFNSNDVENAYQMIVSCDADFSNVKFKTFLKAIVRKKIEVSVKDTAIQNQSYKKIDNDIVLEEVVKKAKTNNLDLVQTITTFTP